jgi:hypothetical protein
MHIVLASVTGHLELLAQLTRLATDGVIRRMLRTGNKKTRQSSYPCRASGHNLKCAAVANGWPTHVPQ